jgi:adenylate kinase
MQKLGYPLKDIGKTMFEIAAQQGSPIDKLKVLDKADRELAPLRAAAFERVLRECVSLDNPFFVKCHSAFRWKNSLRKAFDLYYLAELKPDMFVCIIDSLPDIYDRMQEDPQWRDKLSLKEIAIWRDEEAVLTELMANYQRKPFYLLGFEEPTQTLVDIIEGKKQRAYVSYPITHMSKTREEWLTQKDQQRDMLRKRFVVFDPLDIKDVGFVGAAIEASEKKQKQFRYTFRSGRTRDLECDEVIQIRNDVNFQTVRRDRKLIDQSHMVVVLYPEAVRSQGVAEEITYGSSDKNVFLITPIKGIDPFTEFNITARFETVEEFLHSDKLGRQ